VEDVKFITRREWRAVPPSKNYIKILPNKIIIHHYGYKMIRTKTKSSKLFNGDITIQNLQRNHMNAHGLIDIKFHFIIAPNGDVYEGRPLNVAGCHCKKQDNFSIAIMLFGNYNVEQPTREQIHSFLQLLKHIRKTYKHIDISRSLYSHSDLAFTLCPGHHLSNMIGMIKNRKGVNYD